ncbi:hypothetical protein GCWU000324_00090 [Kingella oralis ATCC 51147]|uniref:Uncharacterized protein n=1 Tax=Kingella oralis ATCC 51147 TaxID=629741 RepID=C4GEK3_9NEIS|nr:hypothetical protein GCWU000324_00090 [Kingella oralis ATCC 51147]
MRQPENGKLVFRLLLVLETACVAVDASYGIRATACYTMQAALAQTPCVLGGWFSGCPNTVCNAVRRQPETA